MISISHILIKYELFLQRSKKTERSGGNKKGANDVKRFIKRITHTKSDEKAEVEYNLDEGKIAEEEKYDDTKPSKFLQIYLRHITIYRLALFSPQ